MTRRWPLIALSAAVAAVGVYKWRQGRMSATGGGGYGTGLSDIGVDDASEDSFPASDAPSWTPVTGSGAQAH